MGGLIAMSDSTYVIKGLMAIVNLDNGSAVHLQKGAVVPSNVDPGHLQHLLDQDLVVKVDGEFVGGLEPVFTGDLQDQVTANDPAELDADDVDGDGPVPAKSATKDVWVAYAVSKGATQEDAEALTKDQLVEQYGAV